MASGLTEFYERFTELEIGCILLIIGALMTKSCEFDFESSSLIDWV